MRRPGLYSIPRRQGGLALIIVLFAVALVVMLVAGMTAQQSLLISKASAYLSREQARSYAEGAEEFSRTTLTQDWEEDKKDNAFIDEGEEPWAKFSAAIPIENGAIQVQVNDLQGLINLNDLVDDRGKVNEIARDRVRRLLEVLEVRSISVEKLIDWIDPDEQTTGVEGAEDSYYLALNPAYRAANQMFADVSELRLIAGAEPEEVDRLLPFVSTLPLRNTGINVNMAPAPVIQSLDPRITEAQALAIIADRVEKPFAAVNEFIARPEFAGLGLKAAGLVVQSHFFAMAAQITYSDQVYRLVSRLYRDDDGAVVVIDRDEGKKYVITKESVSLEQ